MTHSIVKLGDVAEFLRGITFKPDDVVPVDEEDAVVCMRTKNVQTLLECDDLLAIPSQFVRRKDQYLSEGDILVSSANSWNLVGKCCWVPALPWRAAFGGFISVLRGDESRVDKRYLYWWFASERIQALLRSFGQKTTNISNLNIERSLRLELPLPPLPEQRHIATILDKADALRTQRREALAQLDRLAQAIFVEMFGDPVANTKRWPKQTLGELLTSIDSGWSPVCLERPTVGDEWGVLKLGAVTKCVFDHRENKALPPGVRPDAAIEVKPGDLLFSRKNTYELVAACAYVEATPPRLMMSDLIFRLQVRDKAPLNKRYLHALLTNRRKRAEVQKLAGGSAGSMPNISKAKLLGMQIELPPISNQEEFAVRVQAAGKHKSVCESALAEADALFTSLQHRAFRGEL